ncbi:Acyl-CoA synthetase (AMP-forming)/AMP-acid ligase II [Thermomonospora echinospora]|uniref:Acyl-CoA synthetase (AMP-forming)/AMP-acid ligase II n=1 Tax=Thermomonospora echinospora TaxID=1992 RepID=A0A1H6DS43_9ACTN|nr:class I adenylate-forming enzyme family protein [Thermomonospora echinospora]SEG87425.1 Acyl-CoA synthetase (AMP-forming)/AMP-acid ligase II [Thermomonospora echinospora]
MVTTEILQRLTGPGGEFELREEEVLGTRLPVFAGRARSLGEVLVRSAAFGDRDYVVTARERLSFAEHAAQVASLARALREDHGVRPGDRVAVNAANHPGWIVSFWGAIAAGAVAVGYNAWWTRHEIEYALGHTEPTVVIADAERAALTPARDGVTLLTLEGDVAELARRHPDAELEIPQAAEDDPAVILYTSGTSGRPKGAVHSHRNLTSVVEYHRTIDALMRAFGDPVDPASRRYLLALPLFHIAGLHNLAVPRLATGSTVVMHEGAFDVDRVLRLIEKERVTNWGAVPTMAHRLMEHGDLSGYDVSSLTAFALASAPSSPAFKDRLRSAFPPARDALVDSYGLTESCTAVTTASPLDLAESPGTLGRPIVGVQVEIRDPEGRTLPVGEEGEVCVRSAYNMLGYWQDPKATGQALDADRWLHTGDIGMLDEQGRLRLTARRTDLILRGGENVYPAEIENVLAEHPGVRECIVLGAPHPDLGQEVTAVVVAAGEPPAERELAEFVGERLAYFKVPSRWRITAEPLPRNATGKVIRQQVEI